MAATAGTFSSLRNRNYRLFAAGQVVSNTGTWMQRIAQDWLVLKLTGSATALGITTGLQFLPLLLFGLWGGVIADRYRKRLLLIGTQSVMGVLALIMSVLVLGGAVEVWHVWALAFALGLATAVDNPARQSFVVEMVGRKDLANAVSLNSANFQLARIVGPAVGGVLITAIGTGWVFAVNALSYVAVLLGLLAMRERELRPAPALPREKGQLREGLRYVRGRPDLLVAIALVGFIGTFGYNFPVTLAAFSGDVFSSGAGSFGLLNTVFAVGSLAGALLAARRGPARLRLLVFAAAAFGALEMLAAVMPAYWSFALVLVPIGMAGLTFNTAANATVQLGSDPAMRGRVMGIYMLVFMGGTPFGGPLTGWIVETFGARAGMLVGGLISLAAAVVVGVLLARHKGVRLRALLGARGRRGAAGRPRALPTAGTVSGATPEPAMARAGAAAGVRDAAGRTSGSGAAPARVPARGSEEAGGKAHGKAPGKTREDTPSRVPAPREAPRSESGGVPVKI